MVYHAGSRRVVSLADGLDADSLTLGDEVFLNNEMTFVLGKAPSGISRVGETAVFDRYTADGRLILKFRDDELIADAAGGLQSVKLENGDQVRWDRPAWIAYEKIERAAGQRCFLDEVPDVRPEQVGGQRDTLNALLAALTTTLVSARDSASLRSGRTLFDPAGRPAGLRQDAHGAGGGRGDRPPHGAEVPLCGGEALGMGEPLCGRDPAEHPQRLSRPPRSGPRRPRRSVSRRNRVRWASSRFGGRTSQR